MGSNHAVRRAVHIGLTVLVVALLGACGDPDTQEGSNDLEPAEEREGEGDPEVQTTGTTPQGEIDFLRAPGAVQAVVDELVVEFGGTLLVSDFNVYDTYIIFEAQDPTKPENFDTYTWRDGQLGPSEPVNVSGYTQEELEADLFDVTEVAWIRVPELVQAALDGTMLEGGTVTAVFADRAYEEGMPVHISISVSGDRRSGSLEATADGTIIEVGTY